MERRQVSAENEFDASVLEDEQPRRDSLHTPVLEGGNTVVTQVLRYEANSKSMRGGIRQLSSTQRDYGGTGQLQMVSPLGGGAGTIIPAVHRRRSLRNRGSFINQVRHGGSKQNTYVVQLDSDTGGIEMQEASKYLLNAVKMREKYKAVDKGQQEGTERLVPPVALSFESGYIQFSGQCTQIVPWEQFTTMSRRCISHCSTLFAAVRVPNVCKCWKKSIISTSFATMRLRIWIAIAAVVAFLPTARRLTMVSISLQS
ncbi:putative AMP deaminase [Trypanosoma cruzi]|uniref:Putative AMP deaminase n=1 Tax=Trypanosoma cruzi TaxID=5693 RepID=A0A2V2UZ52_TRYCR|nr:putative AMP deaminase [Trypanosoma cruzi]